MEGREWGALQAGEGSASSAPKCASDSHHAQRIGAEFRGSSKYASIPALKEEDQGRRDDLWSLLYVLVEFLVGELPWTQVCEGCSEKIAPPI